MVGSAKLQASPKAGHQRLPEFRREAWVPVAGDGEWHAVVAGDMLEEGVGDSMDFGASERYEHNHLGEAVHAHHYAGVAVILRKLSHKIYVYLLPWLLGHGEWLVQASEPASVGLVALTFITLGYVLLHIPTHARPIK